jgi:glycosyltransferase involved in cell wall biosynthesis
VFVDNGSKDQSVALARETVAEAPDHVTCKVISLAQERPLCPFFNTAVAASTGGFVKPISADDRLGPNFFPMFRRTVATSAPNVGVWLAGSVVIDEMDRVVRQDYGPTEFGSPDDGPPVTLQERHLLDHSGPILRAPSMFYRRRVYDEMGGYDERFRYEDNPFLFSALQHGWTVVVHPYNNTYYRTHGQGISANPLWMAEARVPVLMDHARRARWRNKPIALYQLARNVRYIAMQRWRTWRAER